MKNQSVFQINKFKLLINLYLLLNMYVINIYLLLLYSQNKEQTNLVLQPIALVKESLQFQSYDH